MVALPPRCFLLSVLMILATVSAHLLKNFDFLIRGLFLGRPRLMVCQSCAAWVHSGLCPTFRRLCSMRSRAADSGQ